MNKRPLDFEIFKTADGSPTLCLKRADGYVEKMHHSGGALSESVYIYHGVLEAALNRRWPIRVLSLGLGLGYNELLTIGELGKRGVSDFELHSFELQESLREGFKAWALEGESSELVEVFAEVAHHVAKALSIESTDLRRWTRDALETQKLRLLGPFPESAPENPRYSVVYFDAFSKKMDPHLWDENALIAQFDKLLDHKAALATYAATGALNRVLKKQGFRLEDKTGFQGKRESTLALRD